MNAKMPSSGKLIILAVSAALLAGCAGNKDEQTSSSKSSSHSKPRETKAYQATYSIPNNFAYQTEHFYYDGAGHWRMDISGQGPTVITVLDEKKDETLGWAEETKQYFRRPSQPTDPLVMRVQMSRMDTGNAESLGVRNVNGHVCNGWRASGTEVWFDEDYGCPVTATSGGITSTLTQFSGTAPDPSVFQPPPDYTEISSGRSTRSSRHSDDSRIFSDIQRYTH